MLAAIRGPASRTVLTVIAAWLASGCDDFRECAEPAADKIAALPTVLSETGLYADLESGTLADGVERFRPANVLWSDGADKARFIALPAGTQIDTRDMDDWAFPVGTKLWKEFTRDGVRVETRLIERLGPAQNDWVAAAYVWRDDEGDALLTTQGASAVRGTQHDVPAARQCRACHGGRTSFALGFSALQLAHDAEPGELALQTLVDTQRLTHAPASIPRVPGDATQRAALGYLHANCGHCHNQARPEPGEARCYDPQNELDFWLRVDSLDSPTDTPTYRSGASSDCIDPGRPESSQLIRRVSTRESSQMPPLATEVIDREAVELLTRWIREM